MKKISYITLHYISNYGSVLQTYATQKIFEQEGYEAECVNYVRENCSSSTVRARNNLQETKPNANPAYRALFYMYYLLSDLRRRHVFEGFLKKHIRMSRLYSSAQELKESPPQADIYCTGSDQTWNSEYNGGVLPEYFLDFAPIGAKRISFASSFGMEQIPEEDTIEILDYLNKYSHISVRETSAKKLLQNCGINNVEVVLDPTLLLSAEQWRKLQITYPKYNYILIFSLYKNKRLDAVAQKVKDFYKLPVVRISFSAKDFSKNGYEYLPSVGKLLGMIDNAAVILTDSFHGTAFSLNYNKEFFVVFPEKYSTRIESLLNLVGCPQRILSVDSDVALAAHSIDYSHVNSILSDERKRSLQFLNKACH